MKSRESNNEIAISDSNNELKQENRKKKNKKKHNKKKKDKIVEEMIADELIYQIEEQRIEDAVFKKVKKYATHLLEENDERTDIQDTTLFKDLRSQGLNDRQIYNELTKRGQKITLIDHYPTEKEIRKKGIGMSEDELMRKMKKHYKNGTMEEFIEKIISDYYENNCRMNDLSLLND
jgi:hypothetical protein